MYFWQLNVDDARQLLNTIQEQITLFDGILVLGILGIGSIGFNDTSNLVNNSIQTSTRNQL
jgi:hypothetical protein